MKEQVYKEVEREQDTSVLSELVKKQKSTKLIKVEYKSCCGCGCTHIPYTLKVPVDYEIENGDIVDDFEIIKEYAV